jgi:hypothetical protein
MRRGRRHRWATISPSIAVSGLRRLPAFAISEKCFVNMFPGRDQRVTLLGPLPTRQSTHALGSDSLVISRPVDRKPNDQWAL